MGKHARTNRKTRYNPEQKRRVSKKESGESRNSTRNPDAATRSLTETPFHPRLEEHVATLSAMPLTAQREDFILRLHETYGSRYVQRLMASMNVQASLTVSQPDDVYEQEADRVADAVTRTINTPVQKQAPEDEELLQGKLTAQRQAPAEEEELLQGKLITQRQAPEEEEELLQGKLITQRQAPEEDEELLQGKMVAQRQAPEEDEELLQGKSIAQRQAPEEEEELQMKPADSPAATAADDVETRINNARGGGNPLGDDVRGPMEEAFGADFSGVRTHTDSEADTLNKQLSARAFTTGHDIFFREGEYSPGSSGGQHLIAHELTHVVQQTGGVQTQPDILEDIVRREEDVEEEEDMEEEEEDKVEGLPAEVIAAVEQQVAVLEDPNPVPEEEQIEEARNQGEEQGRQLEALAAVNKPLAELLLLDMQERAAQEPEPPKGRWGRFKAWFKGPGKSVKKLEKKVKKQKRKKGGKLLVAAGKQTARIAILMKSIPGVISHFFSFISMISDFRAWRSSWQKYKDLKVALQEAKESAHEQFDPQMAEVIAAVETAMSKKLRKFWRRVASFISTLTVTGVSMAAFIAGESLTIAGVTALLASNPVGWGIALALGGIALVGGLAILGHKIYRWFKKKKAFALGKDRAETTATLYSALVVGEEPGKSLAGQAITILGLSPDLMVQGYEEAVNSKARLRSSKASIKLIANKLKTT